MAGRPNDGKHNPRDPPGGTRPMGSAKFGIPHEGVARLTRRGWLAASVAGSLCGLWSRSWAADEAETVEEAQVNERARKVGLGPLHSSRTEHYLGIGDAPDPFRNQALVRCGE